MARIRASLLASATLSTALTLSAQQPAKQPAMPATHTVVRGETLWGLAKQYLGDAYLWPEIYRLNTSVVEDPHWIYPGEVLKLPAGVSSAVAAGPAAGPSRAAPYDPNASTIFDPRRYKQTQRAERQSANLLRSRFAVRSGEYLEAPFAWAIGGPAGAGQVLRTATSQIVEPTLAERSIQSAEPVFLRLPEGAVRQNGQRFLIVQLGPRLDQSTQAVIVHGVAELRGDAGTGDARAIIRQRFRPIESGLSVVALDTLVPRLDVHPLPVEYGAPTKLTWLLDDPVIPQLGSYVLLAASAKDGIATGDQVTLYAPLGAGAQGVPHAPEMAAVVQVLRVTPFGSSGIIIARSQAGITNGMDGRVTAKMP